MDIAISDETGELLETGGGLKKASWYFEDGEPFVVRNVDVLSDLNLDELLGAHLQRSGLATLVVRNRETSRYLLFDDSRLICGWENRKTEEKLMCRETDLVSPFAFSGIQILSPEILPLISEQGSFSLIKLYLRLAKSHDIYGFLDDLSHWRDAGKLN